MCPWLGVLCEAWIPRGCGSGDAYIRRAVLWSQTICTHTVYLTFRDQSNSGITLGAENIWTVPGTHGADNYAADSAVVLISKRLRARGRAAARVETRSPLTCDCQKSRAHAHLPPAAATIIRRILLFHYYLLCIMCIYYIYTHTRYTPRLYQQLSAKFLEILYYYTFFLKKFESNYVASIGLYLPSSAVI